jgi:hypothetical protein
MSGLNDGLIFLGLIVFLISLGVGLYLLIERRRKAILNRRFRSFHAQQDLSGKDLRTVPRITIPESMDVILSFLDEKHLERRAFATDISMNGLAAQPDFSVRKVSNDLVLENVQVETPINQFFINKLKLVRVGSPIEQKLLAFTFEKMDEEQFEELRIFMNHLNKFLSHDH